MDSRQKYEKEKVLFAITLCSVQVFIYGKFYFRERYRYI